MSDKKDKPDTKSNPLSEILSHIQRELHAPKNQFNKFGNYSYRNCEDILQALKPWMKDGLFVLITDEIVSVANRIYVKATASISNGKETISVSAFAREAEDRKGMDSSQTTGSASSYARKYALNGLFMIDDNKDADSKNDKGELVTASSESVDNAKKEVAAFFSEYTSCIARNIEAITDIKAAIESGDITQAAGFWYEMISEEDQIILYRLAPTKGGIWSTEERGLILNEFRQLYYGDSPNKENQK